MKKITLFSLFLILPLSACKTTVRGDHPDVTVKGDGYEVSVGDHNGRSNDTFCPPGQAKKGNC